MNDVRRMIYGTLALFLIGVVAWITTLMLFSCGLNLACRQAAPRVDRTPIPTLIPVKHGEVETQPVTVAEFNKCEVVATDLIGAWVSAGAPEAETFPFSDVNGNPCEGTFEDIHPLFVENSLWKKGFIGCVSCHNAVLTERSGGLDLTTYEGIIMGSGRVDANAQGKDILGNGTWESSALYTVLVEQGFVPEGHSPDSPPVQLVIYAGQTVAAIEVTPTPTP